MRLHGLQKKLYRMTYDKTGLNRKTLQLHRSLDEVKQLIGGGAGTRRNGAEGGNSGK